MKGKKLYMIIESVLLVLTAGLPAAAAVRMYIRGTAMQASGDLFSYIYTRETVGTELYRLLPLFTAFIAFTAAGWIMGIRDEKADKPAALRGMDVKQSVEKGISRKSGLHGNILRIVILILAVTMILLGIRNGGAGDVFAKGASVCTECIGLG